MKKTFCSFLLIFVLLSSCQKKSVDGDLNQLSSQNAVHRLEEGNKRFVNNTLLHLRQGDKRRLELVKKQSPYAVIVGCSDSRVPPEIIFDEGLGDLFVVRVAGNVIGPIELQSIEYSVLHLDPAVVIVLGHENCGAVNAVVKNEASDIEDIAVLIQPALEDKEKLLQNNILESAIKKNALNMKNLLETSPRLGKVLQDKKIEVHAAYYNLETGIVELLDH